MIRIDEAEAERTLALLTEMGEVLAELDAMRDARCGVIVHFVQIDTVDVKNFNEFIIL